ncbi:hypothetical protein [Bifidobacterium aquikefiri]|uniref:hypothetical protein n=1 Tax=Bifidobacterium aquikefiri TaxID=1653207 RepID=UPI0039ECBC8F
MRTASQTIPSPQSHVDTSQNTTGKKQPMNTTATAPVEVTLHKQAASIEMEQLQALLESQAKRIAELQDEIKTREDEVANIKNTILDQWQPGKYDAGSLTVQVKEGAKTINASKFTKTFPPTEYPDLYKLAPDSKEARKQLGEQQLAPVMTSRKPSVVIA